MDYIFIVARVLSLAEVEKWLTEMGDYGCNGRYQIKQNFTNRYRIQHEKIFHLSITNFSSAFHVKTSALGEQNKLLKILLLLYEIQRYHR